jgi:hypothetical protein
MFIALCFFSHPSCPVRADIIVLDYIVKRQLILKLEKNETVSLIFSNNWKAVAKKNVSKDYNNLNPFHPYQCCAVRKFALQKRVV